MTVNAASTKARAAWGGERVLALLFLMLCVCYGAGTFSFMQTTDSDVVGPATFPRILAVLGGICAVAFLIRSGRKADSQSASESHSISDLLPLGLTLAYALAFEPLGFALSTFLYLIIAMRTLGKGWRYAVVASLASTILFYLAFSVLLDSHLPEGPLPISRLVALV